MIFATLLLAAGWRLNSWDIERTALIGLVLMGLITWAAWVTGQNSHEVIHDLVTVPHAVIDEHGAWATRTLIVIGITGLLAVWGLWRPLVGQWKTGLLFVAILGSSLAFYTAHLGGLIHHPEIWPLFQTPSHPGHHH